MTKKEFMDRLQSYNVEWILNDIIRVKARFRSSPMCPICFLAFKEGRGYFPNYRFYGAGDALGLKRGVVDQIVSAADNKRDAKVTRRMLLKACKQITL